MGINEPIMNENITRRCTRTLVPLRSIAKDTDKPLSHLVNVQSGYAHFTTGVATVGGRTHIGVLDLKDGWG